MTKQQRGTSSTVSDTACDKDWDLGQSKQLNIIIPSDMEEKTLNDVSVYLSIYRSIYLCIYIYISIDLRIDLSI